MHSPPLTILAISFAIAAPSAWALPTVEFTSTASGGYSYAQGPKSSQLDMTESDTLGDLVSVAADKNGYGFEARAKLDNTALSAFAGTTYPTTSGSSGTANALATASLTDFITFSGGSGMGTASLTALLTGTLTGTSVGNAGYDLNIALYDVTDVNGSYSLSNPLLLAADTRSISGGQLVTVDDSFQSSFDFEYGKTYGIIASFSVNATNGGIADFSNTTSFAMAAAPSVSLHSIAGINYGIAAAVPEPESYAMLLAGLGLMGLIAHRRR